MGHSLLNYVARNANYAAHFVAVLPHYLVILADINTGCLDSLIVNLLSVSLTNCRLCKKNCIGIFGAQECREECNFIQVFDVNLIKCFILVIGKSLEYYFLLARV